MKGCKSLLSKALRSIRKLNRFRTLIVTLSAIVVFVVSYLLVLPALTLDKNEVEKQGGIDIVSEDSEAVSQESAQEESKEPTSTEKEKKTEQKQDAPTFKSGELSYAGKSFDIEASYKKKAEIPDNAQLKVKEISKSSDQYDQYYQKALEMLREQSKEPVTMLSYARFFDISIEDESGDEVQPAKGSTVSMEIRLDGCGEEDPQVIHFGKKTEMLETETSGDTVSFETTGFSAYAIVSGPTDVPLGWKVVNDLDELKSLATEGLYIGHVDGYYLTNGITVITSNPRRTGITKTTPAQSYPAETAVKYYFEQAEGTEDQFYVYCYDGETKQYVYNGGNNSLSFTGEENKTAFTVKVDGNSQFTLNSGSWYWNMQGGKNGKSFAAYNNATDNNNKLYIWHYSSAEEDPYNLDGKSYGLMNWNGGAAGKAMMSTSKNENTLDALALTVLSKDSNHDDKLFVPADSDISMWTFEWEQDDQYYIKTVFDGSTKYLKISSDGLALVSDKNEAGLIQVVPGTGSHAGEICLKSGGTTLTYSGSVDNGFNTGGSVGSEWLKLVELSELTPDYSMTYSARKVSVSDPGVTNGSHIIVYTRVWNEEKLKYELYAIGHDGSLVKCYESGDSIQWSGSVLNSLLWDFVEYYWEGTDDPNYYYELYNEYSEKYIAPQDNQILSDDPIGINLTGRQKGAYYSPILAWDDANYAYMGIKADVNSGRIIECPNSEAGDFYFAVMQEIQVDDDLTTVPTVDNRQHGITMKMVDFSTEKWMDDYLGSSAGGAVHVTQSGLLSTKLEENGYPVITAKAAAGTSLAEMYNSGEGGLQEVNHLFIESTYKATGYYEYDSAQNYAYLDGTDFKVYKEIGTNDSKSSTTMKHGQFLPYNDIEPGVFAAVNPKNLYATTGGLLPDSDPRKHEQLYLAQGKLDYYLGVELEASFTQTPNGKDDWGHDIIFEFTGDDDFWLYVDGELVLDLGGIHSALPGSVNFSNGHVNVNGTNTTLRELFESNYRARNQGADDAEVAAFLAQYFDEGSTVFKDYTNHTMRIFYMERGAGASNLHMRFNLASINPGTVQLSKELKGIDSTESVLAEYPYQIKYKKDDTEYYLTNQVPGDADRVRNYVYYKGTVNPVKYKTSLDIAGVTYRDVFMLEPGEIAEISFPTFGENNETIESYSIVECGLDTTVYNKVEVNNSEITGTAAAEGREDYGIDYATTDARPRVIYSNTVDPEAIRTLTIKKKLYKEDGTTEITDDPTTFNFRLYLATEYDALDVTNMKTYHVKDPDGNYCRWDAATQTFVSLGKSSYSTLTDEEKQAARFTTSMNGSVSKIPIRYTVEIRDVLAGSKFGVQERPGEIPDGYSFQKYVYYKDRDGEPEDTLPDYVIPSSAPGAEAGVADIIVSNQDPHVDICNLKGWGLRVNKTWSDADYMTSRDATYFAVFTKTDPADDESGLTLVDGTVRRLSYNENTLYWYFLPLPVQVPFDQYYIREVTFTGGTPLVDENGVVTGPDTLVVHPIANGEALKLKGIQKGETKSSPISYTVQYNAGAPDPDSNVRVDQVTNSRPGVVLKKQDWNGNALEGATFKLSLQEGPEETVIGTFTSNADGLITEAYLRDGAEYILTETRTPQGYHGLGEPMIIKQITTSEGGTESRKLEVNYPNQKYYFVDTADHNLTLTIKNRPYHFKAVKIDGSTTTPMPGVHFEIHRQITVGGVTSFDLNPMPGFEDLMSDVEGVIPGLDDRLPPGTYQLREKETPEGYEELSKHTVFKVSETGYITLIENDPAVELSQESGEADQSIEYILTVKNMKPGIELPSTGGVGTRLIYLLGGLMTAFAAAALFIRRRRREAL